METRIIAGFNGDYQITENGVVISLKQDKIRELKQSLDRKGYATVTLSKYGKSKTYRVHRLVAKAFLSDYSDYLQVDHINNIRNDNRLINLRMADASQNQSNAGVRSKNKTSNYKGVYYDKKQKLYVARISKWGKMIYAGKSKIELEAAMIYDKKVTEIHGDYAVTNESLGLIKPAPPRDYRC